MRQYTPRGGGCATPASQLFHATASASGREDGIGDVVDGPIAVDAAQQSSLTIEIEQRTRLTVKHQQATLDHRRVSVAYSALRDAVGDAASCPRITHRQVHDNIDRDSVRWCNRARTSRLCQRARELGMLAAERIGLPSRPRECDPTTRRRHGGARWGSLYARAR